MIAIANDDLEWPGIAMPGTVPLSLGNADRLAGVVEQEPVAVVLVAPAHADHAVVFLPAAEGIVGGMDDDQANLACFEALLELLVELVRPGSAVVVAHQHVVL